MQQHQQGRGERPYRSHLRPACLTCRRRKSRCHTEPGADRCLMCRAHGTDCLFPGGSPGPASKDSPDQVARRRGRGKSSATPRITTPPFHPVSGPRAHPTVASTSIPGPQNGDMVPGSASSSSAYNPSLNPPPNRSHHQQEMHGGDSPSIEFGSADDHASNLHIVGPATTKDNQVLSDYLSAIPGATRGTRMVVPVPASRSRPVLFTRVQKRPFGVPVNRSPSAEKLEMIEKLLEPYAGDVIDLYFGKVNICFPLLDEVSFRQQWLENKERISPALLACLYAHTMAYWQYSPALAHRKCPDVRFIWNLANDAVYSELHLSPGMSIIKAIVLNVGGLPTTSLIGNGVLLGSAVSVAYSLGLNRNPMSWEITHSEKCLRMKIWWTLLIHDRWTSLAHGTPPHILPTQYDVPLPSLEYMADNAASGMQHRAASVFIALASLTDVLDQHLQYIYQVRKDETGSTVQLELALNNWVESLSGTVRLIILRGSHLDIPGAANLRFSYLTTRLLLERIELEADKQSYDPHDQRLSNRYIQARRTAEEILIMTQELQQEQMGDFWLATSAFSYPATVNFLLRCGLETESSPVELVRSPPFKIAQDLIETLRSHQDKFSWDLARVCLAQHAEIVDKILSSVSSSESQGGNSGSFDPQEFVLPDASFIDQFFPSLWDPLQNAW
ncbi:unnamed protein product [Clonostachys rhizophaga]|uniref:Zn(2)-C6 fungal-type domain-containing protein n=1 Tax=Clonostachys rhizophaga TaxID=160324 RepID=A0A9N9V0P9_9HYPO|nr:unnamed protein product [Clonostachys rhizophaga]